MKRYILIFAVLVLVLNGIYAAQVGRQHQKHKHLRHHRPDHHESELNETQSSNHHSEESNGLPPAENQKPRIAGDDEERDGQVQKAGIPGPEDEDYANDERYRRSFGYYPARGRRSFGYYPARGRRHHRPDHHESELNETQSSNSHPENEVQSMGFVDDGSDYANDERYPRSFGYYPGRGRRSFGYYPARGRRSFGYYPARGRRHHRPDHHGNGFDLSTPTPNFHDFEDEHEKEWANQGIPEINRGSGYQPQFIYPRPSHNDNKNGHVDANNEFKNGWHFRIPEVAFDPSNNVDVKDEGIAKRNARYPRSFGYYPGRGRRSFGYYPARGRRDHYPDHFEHFP